MYIAHFHIDNDDDNDNSIQSKNDIALTALYQFLRLPTTIKGLSGDDDLWLIIGSFCCLC